MPKIIPLINENEKHDRFMIGYKIRDWGYGFSLIESRLNRLKSSPKRSFEFWFKILLNSTLYVLSRFDLIESRYWSVYLINFPKTVCQYNSQSPMLILSFVNCNQLSLDQRDHINWCQPYSTGNYHEVKFQEIDSHIFQEVKRTIRR